MKFKESTISSKLNNKLRIIRGKRLAYSSREKPSLILTSIDILIKYKEEENHFNQGSIKHLVPFNMPTLRNLKG